MCSSIPNPKAFPILKTVSGVGSQLLNFTSATVTDTLAQNKFGRDRAYVAQNSRLQPITEGNQGRSSKASLFVIPYSITTYQGTHFTAKEVG